MIDIIIYPALSFTLFPWSIFLFSFLLLYKSKLFILSYTASKYFYYICERLPNCTHMVYLLLESTLSDNYKTCVKWKLSVWATKIANNFFLKFTEHFFVSFFFRPKFKKYWLFRLSIFLMIYMSHEVIAHIKISLKNKIVYFRKKFKWTNSNPNLQLHLIR